MKIYVTKNALTTGIEECVAMTLPDISESMVKTCDGRYFHGEGRDWHRDRLSAVTRAEKMRAAKIALLEKSIAMLTRLKFQ